MKDFGELLYEGKTDTNKNSYGFILIGILLFVAANFIYAKAMLMIFGGLFVLFGLYLLIFKRSEKFSIFEHVITFVVKGEEFVIPKEQIDHIAYQELKVRRSPVVNYYPVLVLKNQKQLLIHKSFNSIVNRDFGKIIKAYI